MSASSLLLLPGDLLIEIALHLQSRADLLHLSLTSPHVFLHISSVLYESVTLASVQQCTSTLGMLAHNSEIARHVRELVIRLQPKYNPALTSAERDIASSAVIAASKSLDALTKFVWDAEEMPYHDDMWFALRVSCPQLCYLGASIGCISPRLNSHLFDFANLTGFALNLKAGFYECHIDLFMDEDQPISRKLWDMLIYRCPNLEELSIEGQSTIPADIHALVEGRWPNLQNLTLGDVCIDWIPRPLTPGQKRPFIAFLEAHRQLRTINLSRHTIQPIHFASLDPESLPVVTSFSGTHQQLQALLHLQPNLKRVAFRDAIETREVSAPTLAGLLRELTCLEELRVTFNLHSMYDSGNLLRSLIQSCPNLRHLELTCGQKLSFQLEAFSKTIRGFPKLRTLHLTVVKYPGDDTLTVGATTIAQSNPQLQNFSLMFIAPGCSPPLPRPFDEDDFREQCGKVGIKGLTQVGLRTATLNALLYPPISFFTLPFLPLITRTSTSGRFSLTTDTHGLPSGLHAHEQIQVTWPGGLGQSVRVKKYERKLGPYARRRSGRGTYEGGVGGLQGFLSLIFERSSAGEEMRMILFCLGLAVIAGWGFVFGGKGNTVDPGTGSELGPSDKCGIEMILTI